MKRTSLILSSLSVLLLFGCAGTSGENRYYTLASESAARVSRGTPYRLFIQKFSIDPAYSQPNIVYRESPYEFMSYGNDFWASSPELQVTNTVASVMRESGLFAQVERRASEIPDLELSGYLNAIEEIDSDSTKAFARVAVEFTIREGKTGKTLWKRAYDEKKALESRTPLEVAKAASALVTRYAEDALGEIEKILAEKAQEIAKTEAP